MDISNSSHAAASTAPTTSPTGRALLSAIAVAPVVVAATAGAAAVAPNSTAAWDAAMRHLAAVQSASDEFDRNNNINNIWAAIDHLPHGPERTAAIRRVPDHVWETSEAFGEQIADAEGALMDLPAPHQQAVLWKLEKVLLPEGNSEDPSTPCWSFAYVEPLLEDVRRFARQEGR